MHNNRSERGRLTCRLFQGPVLSREHLKCSRAWEWLFLIMCGSALCVGMPSEKRREVFLVRQLHQALVETYHANWRKFLTTLDLIVSRILLNTFGCWYTTSKVMLSLPNQVSLNG